MQLKPLVTILVIGIVGVGCGSADGPSIWGSGLSVSGGSGPDCTAFQECCTELEQTGENGASCNGSAPTDEPTCAAALAALEEFGSCTDIAIPDSGISTGTGTGTGSTTTSSFACDIESEGLCMVFRNFTDPETSCSISQGTPVSSCPTVGLLGCCNPKTTSATEENNESCFYTNGALTTAADAMSQCGADDSTYSSLP